MNKLMMRIAASTALLAALVVPIAVHEAKIKGNASIPTQTENVLILGASVAEGWDDKGAGGYLIRAFQTLSQSSGVHYNVTNKAHAGNGVLQVVKQYPVWVKAYKPDVVVLSWGGLDDLTEKTPMSTVAAQVAWEARYALAHHATVMLVTPPITPATYVGKLAPLEPSYVQHEMAGARSVKSANVYVFDVFHQMKDYVAAHHQSYKIYAGDGWHPNTAGHVLAAQFLVNDVQKVFGQKPITFKEGK